MTLQIYAVLRLITSARKSLSVAATPLIGKHRFLFHRIQVELEEFTKEYQRRCENSWNYADLHQSSSDVTVKVKEFLPLRGQIMTNLYRIGTLQDDSSCARRPMQKSVDWQCDRHPTKYNSIYFSIAYNQSMMSQIAGIKQRCCHVRRHSCISSTSVNIT